MSSRLQNTQQCIAAIAEDVGKPASKFTNTFWPWMNSLKAIFFFRKKAFTVQTALSFFTVNALVRRQLPSVDMSMPNRHAHVRIGPIWDPPIKDTRICPCDSTGYQNELLCTKSQTDFNNGLRHPWAGCNAGYHILHRSEEDSFLNKKEVLNSMQFCFTCLIVIEKHCLLLPEGTMYFADVAI